MRSHACWSPGGWFNKKMPSYQCRKSHCGDKTILRPSYLHNEIAHTGKMTSLYWIRTLCINLDVMNVYPNKTSWIISFRFHPFIFAFTFKILTWLRRPPQLVWRSLSGRMTFSSCAAAHLKWPCGTSSLTNLASFWERFFSISTPPTSKTSLPGELLSHRHRYNCLIQKIIYIILNYMQHTALVSYQPFHFKIGLKQISTIDIR